MPEGSKVRDASRCAVGGRDHISVCVCTFRRPVLLDRLLHALVAQALDATFTFDVVVVDNDCARSSEDVVGRVTARAEVAMTYVTEPMRNISRARNRAVEAST